MGLSLVGLAWIIGLVGSVYSAVSMGIGPCPGGRKPGDKWYLPGCQECDCSDGSYVCYSCGSVHIPSDCYAEYPQTNYPDCCVPNLRCRSESRFSKAKLAAKLLKADLPLGDSPAKNKRRKTKAKNKAATLMIKTNKRRRIVKKNKKTKVQDNNTN